MYICGQFITLADLIVSIMVTYNAPPDFTLSTPPYYRPASSVTLSCITSEATLPVSYHWSSTNNASFAHNQTTKTITKSILTSSDAGVHTCTATDADGNVVHSSTKMKVVGKSSTISSYSANTQTFVFQVVEYMLRIASIYLIHQWLITQLYR